MYGCLFITMSSILLRKYTAYFEKSELSLYLFCTWRVFCIKYFQCASSLSDVYMSAIKTFTYLNICRLNAENFGLPFEGFCKMIPVLKYLLLPYFSNRLKVLYNIKITYYTNILGMCRFFYFAGSFS